MALSCPCLWSWEVRKTGSPSQAFSFLHKWLFITQVTFYHACLNGREWDHMSSLNCREMCDYRLQSFSWNSIIMGKEEILCKELWADWCRYQEGKMLARHHVLSQPCEGPSDGLCNLLYAHSVLKELGKKYHGPGRKETSGSRWRDAEVRPSPRRPWLAHLEVVKALVSTDVCYTTDPWGGALKYMHYAERRCGEQYGPGDKGSLRVKTPEKETSHGFHWVEAKKGESK